MIEPRIRNVPLHVGSLGPDARELAEKTAGIHLDDWQALVLDAGMSVRADDRWAAFEVCTKVARQNGKNEIALVRELAGVFLLGERLIVHCAQSAKTANEHYRRVEETLTRSAELAPYVASFRHANGNEEIEFTSGQRIQFVPRTSIAGLGHTVDTIVFDEAMIFADATLDALMPTLAARSIVGNPQLWYFATAYDQLLPKHTGLVFPRLRERGMRGDPRLAYFEWSLDDTAWGAQGEPGGPDSVPPEVAGDPEMQKLSNPALDVRISREYVADERRQLSSRGFAVQRLSVGDYPVSTSGTLNPIDLEAFDLLEDPASRPLDPVVFAFDVTPARSAAAIAVAGLRSDGVPHVEVVDHREGTGWVVPRLAELQARWRPDAIGYGKDGPAESLAPDLERVRIRDARGLTTAENAAACGRLVDAVANEALRHLGDRSPHGAALRAAIAGAVPKSYGDRWLWSRAKSTIDVSPLVAATLALYLLTAADSRPKVGPLIAFR